MMRKSLERYDLPQPHSSFFVYASPCRVIGLRVKTSSLRKRVLQKDGSVDVAEVASRMVVSPNVLILLMLHQGGMIGLVATMPRQSMLRESVSLL